MDANEILRIFGPMLDDGLLRLGKRTGRVDNRDIISIFSPIVVCIALAAGADAASATGRLTSWCPADVTQEALRGLVRGIAESAIPAVDWDAVQRKQAELEAELATVRGAERPSLV